MALDQEPSIMQSQAPPFPIRTGRQLPGHGRRSRVPLSCDPCRTRGQQTTCNFRGPATVTAAPVGGKAVAVQERIENLETLVKKLVAQRERQPPSDLTSIRKSTQEDRGLVGTTADANNSDATRAGTTIVDGVHSVYQGGEDWGDVLNEINELKNTWRHTRDEPNHHNLNSTVSYTADGTSLLFGQVKPIERTEILSALPVKPEVDKLIKRFFDYQSFPITIPPILHKPTFMQEYHEHWRDPSRTNLIWIGLLFSILGINMLSYHQSGEPPEYQGTSESLLQLHRTRTAQCLLAGDIAKCLPYTVETLRFNATAELSRKDDNRRGLWIMTGVIIRAAISMGYHRDPSELPSISVLQAEYRRRTWLSVVTMDNMVSFLGSFPRTMAAVYSDTLEPRNISDSELLEDSSSLPPSRPLSEATPITYTIVKGRLFKALSRITDSSHSPNSSSYDTILEIDEAIHEVYWNFPPHMQVDVRGDPSSRVTTGSAFSNLSLACMYHKGMCVLHRKYMAKGARDTRFKLSRERCISSALTLLSYQQILQPSWYKFAHSRQILTFAATILFLELELRQQISDIIQLPEFGTDVLRQALEDSCALWKNASGTSEDAGTVYKTLTAMLSSCNDPARTDPTPKATDNPPFTVPSLKLTSGPLTSDPAWEDGSSNMDIDWATWDAFIDNTAFETGPVY